MIIYPTRHQARKARRYEECIIKVEGGYMLMNYYVWRIWKKQKRPIEYKILDLVSNG